MGPPAADLDYVIEVLDKWRQFNIIGQ